MVLLAVFLLALLNLNPAIHSVIINLDIQIALKMNSLIGINPFFDHALAWLSTSTGDVFILVCICLLFVTSSLHSANLNETTRRLSFWAWVGTLCLITYGISCASEQFIKRDTPLLALHQLKNLQTICGTMFHSCPTSSFPSGHGFAYFFFAMMAWKRYFRISLVLWCLAIIMLSLRLIIGLHWFSDIAFGSLFLSALLVTLIEDTPLKNTYKYTEQAVSYLIKTLLVGREELFEVCIPQNKHRRIN